MLHAVTTARPPPDVVRLSSNAHQVDGVDVAHLVQLEDAVLRSMWTVSTTQTQLSNACQMLQQQNQVLASVHMHLQQMTRPYTNQE